VLKKIVKGLIERGVNVKTELLDKGDYILSDQCAVERKTVRDFIYTLTRRYLFEQLFGLKEAYPKALYSAGRLHADNLQVQQHLAQRDFGEPCSIWLKTGFLWLILLRIRRLWIFLRSGKARADY